MSALFGMKGSDAPALLQHLGVQIPAQPNRVVHWPADSALGAGRCLRLGSTEFLIELDAAIPPIMPAGEFPNAWTLIRSDHSLLLAGEWCPRELSQLCSFDFTRLQHDPDLVVMTLLAGISVTLIREPAIAASETGGMPLRLWCDATLSVYLQQCLHSIRGSR